MSFTKSFEIGALATNWFLSDEYEIPAIALLEEEYEPPFAQFEYWLHPTYANAPKDNNDDNKEPENPENFKKSHKIFVIFCSVVGIAILTAVAAVLISRYRKKKIGAYMKNVDELTLQSTEPSNFICTCPETKFNLKIKLKL